jgi:hypothetical protein
MGRVKNSATSSGLEYSDAFAHSRTPDSAPAAPLGFPFGAGHLRCEGDARMEERQRRNRRQRAAEFKRDAVELVEADDGVL